MSDFHWMLSAFIEEAESATSRKQRKAEKKAVGRRRGMAETLDIEYAPFFGLNNRRIGYVPVAKKKSGEWPKFVMWKGRFLFGHRRDIVEYWEHELVQLGESFQRDCPTTIQGKLSVEVDRGGVHPWEV